MVNSLRIDPITRLEGHLAIQIDVENDRVTSAQAAGEMFRGFEIILQGRDPLDAQQITQRICGVCPIAHGTASILAQDQAYGITPPPNGRLVRNLILGANYIQSHIIHFYQLSALDFVDIAAILAYQGKDPQLLSLRDWVKTQSTSQTLFPAAPFLPRYEGTYLTETELNIAAIKHYLEALKMRQIAHQAAALFCGKIPHATALVPGGVTEHVDSTKIAAYRSKLLALKTFIETCYLPDVIEVASAFVDYFQIGNGYGNYLTYGVFPESDTPGDTFLPSGVFLNGSLQPLDSNLITEDVAASYFSSSSHVSPSQGETTPAPNKTGAYSWLKAPRYQSHPMEVGPLARIFVAYKHGKNSSLNALVNQVLTRLGGTEAALNSVLGRHAARAIECKLVADRCLAWVDQLKPNQPTFTDFTVPETCQGIGLTEAPRGALGHWLQINGRKISRYQCVVPTTWNCSPRDDKGQPGAVEHALENTPIEDEKNPIEATRVVRSFDPCLACAVH